MSSSSTWTETAAPLTQSVCSCISDLLEHASRRVELRSFVLQMLRLLQRWARSMFLVGLWLTEALER